MVPLPPLPVECHPQPACISGSSQRPECQARSTGVDLSVARHALFTLFTWKTRFLLRFMSPCGGGLSKDRPSSRLFGSFLPALMSGLVFSLSRKAMGSGAPGQRPGLWVLVFPLLLFHEPPRKPIWHTHWRGALLRSQSTWTQIVLSYPHCSPVGPVRL